MGSQQSAEGDASPSGSTVTPQEQSASPTPPGAFPESTLQPLPGSSTAQAPLIPATTLHPHPPSTRARGRPRMLIPRRTPSGIAGQAARKALSYFVPISEPDLVHSHTLSGPDEFSYQPVHIRHVNHYLSKRLLPELVPKVLQEAEFWSTCTRGSKRHVTVTAGTRSPRIGMGVTATMWTSGQEEELADLMNEDDEKSLKDGDGKVWYLVSEPIGCVEKHDEERRDSAANTGTNTPEIRDKGKEKEVDSPSEAEKEGWDMVGVDSGESESGTYSRRDKVWLMRMRVTTVSKDQGWSSSSREHYGTYDQSYTWFDISLLRDGKEVEGSRTDIQHNVHAGQYFKDHVNTFERDHPFVKLAKPGDRFVLWVRAQYPGWSNHVREASITMWTSQMPPNT